MYNTPVEISPAELKINFADFWPGFDKTNNFFYNLLAEKYTIVIADKPDLLFYSVYGRAHSHYNCTKILYTGEPQRPDFILCDFAFSYEYPVTRKNYRLPLYALYGDVNQLVHRKTNLGAILMMKKKFCCFVVSNEACKARNDFFHALSKYKQVDSGGRLFNNVGGPVENKLDFIKDYKFVIAFESMFYRGYTSEKIFEPFIQNCVPIYWGDPLVANDFNTKSFINCHDYPSFEAVINHIIEVDNNDDLYLKYLAEPVFINNELNAFVKKENIGKRLDEIVDFHFNGKFKFLPKIRPAYFLLLTGVQYLKSAYLFTEKFTLRIIHKAWAIFKQLILSNSDAKR